MLAAPRPPAPAERPVAVLRARQQAGRGEEHPARVVGHFERHHVGGRRLRLAQPGAARRGVLLGDLRQLRGDQLAQLRVGVQDARQLLDLARQPVALGLQLDAVELGQAAQRRVEDVLGLDLRQAEAPDQRLLGLRRVLAGADEPDDLVDVDQRDEQALDQVQPVAPLAAPELAAPPHHLEAVVDVDLKQLAQAHRQRLPVDERHVVDAEGLLHRRQLVELGEHRLGVEPVLHLDDQPQPVLPVRQVLDVRDALQALGVHQVLDLADDLLGADGERQLGDDEAAAARRHLLLGHRRPHPERATARLVRVPDAVQADDLTARRQVGTRHHPHQRGQVGRRVPDQVPGRRDHLAEVVRRHVGRHADGDAARPVDQEIGVGGRQRHRLALAAVVVGREVDRVLVDGLHHQPGRGCGAALRVPHGGGRVVVAERSEVPVAVDEGKPHRERLRHPYECVVDRRVPVRVELAHHLADHPCTLHVPAIGPQTHVVHLVQDPAVHRLHPVPCVGKRPGVDHRVGVLQEGALHLIDDVDVQDALLELLGRRGLRTAAGHRGRAPSYGWAVAADHCGPRHRQQGTSHTPAHLA